MKKKHVIVAPHADDELIGCFSLLDKRSVHTVVVPNQTAKKEMFPCQDMYGFEIQIGDELNIYNLAVFARELGGNIFFPDPIHEYHHAHRFWGAQGEKVYRQGQHNVAFYTVNMMAPYVSDSYIPTRKKAKLDVCYPGKKDLWKYDHKYFLFEGYSQWLNPAALWQD